MAKQPVVLPPEHCLQCSLRAHTVYAPASAADVNRIAAMRRRILTLPARRIILQEGERPEEAYTLFSGWAFRFKLLSDGRRQILSYLLPGDQVSFPLLLDQPLYFSVQSLTDVTLCAFDRREMARFIAANPVLYVKAATITAQKVAVLDQRIIDLGRCSALERMVRFLIEMEMRLNARGMAHGDTWPLPLRQEHIADTLGLTVVHVSRTIAALRKSGLVTVAHGMVTVYNRTRMLEIAGPLPPVIRVDQQALAS